MTIAFHDSDALVSLKGTARNVNAGPRGHESHSATTGSRLNYGGEAVTEQPDEVHINTSDLGAERDFGISAKR
jgi:hypothetical protein